MLHEKADENIVQDNTGHHQQEIPEKLHTPVKYRTREDHISHQHKPSRKTDQEGNDKGSYIRFEGDETQVQNFFMKNIIVGKEENENVQNRIGATTGGIPEGL